MTPIIRTIDAAIGETIEVRWVRRIPDPGDPTKRLTQTLHCRYSAPPTSVWDARLADAPEETPHD